MQRKNGTKAIQLAVCMALAVSHPAAVRAQAPDDRAQRMLNVQKVMLARMDNLNRDLVKKPDGVTTRDLSNASLLILRSNGSPASAETYLRRVFAVQNMTESAREYGAIPWSLNDPSVKDGNAIEFSMQALGAVYLGYGDRLSSSFKKDSDQHLRAALVALANHKVKVDYTNIFLMNTMDTIELAEYLGDNDALQRGYKQWQQWWAYTGQYGIHEFDSPTYYAVDLGDLVLGYMYVKDPAIHSQIKAALDMFWRDIAGNYLLADGRLAGAHSRDYAFLTGRGGIEFYLYMEGLFSPGKRKFQDIFLEKVDLLESERQGGYRVSPEILSLAKLPARIIEQQWNVDAGARRYTYLTQNFGMGYAIGKSGEQDKMFAADLAGKDPENPPISIALTPDVVDAPYGVEKKVDRSGHLKPVHLPLNLSAVQDKGIALLVADLDPMDATNNPTFATNLILPSSATRILVDNAALKVSSGLKLSFGAQSILGVRTDKSCFVARIITADSLLGIAPKIELKADSQGLENGALRLAIYHAQTSFATTDQRHLHVVLLVEASDCKSDAELSALMEAMRKAKVESTETSGGWQGAVHVGAIKLELVEDPSTRRPGRAAVNDRPVTTPVFTLNGQNMGLSSSTN